MTASQFPTGPLDINDIMRIIPHRYPFLLIDRILEIRDKFIASQKCVTVNEPYFMGHFPGRPVMPGVLMLEAMAQTGAVMVQMYAENQGKLIVLAAVDDARFKKIVTPGDVLRIEMTEVFRRRGVGRCSGVILVEGQVVCEATLTFAVSGPSPHA